LAFRVLILEDDKLFGETIEEHLVYNGFVCDRACNVDDAYELTYGNRFDIYLLDINMPTSSGIEFLKMLRSSGDSTPALFMTSYKEIDMLNQAFGSGGDDYLRKPFELVELSLRMEALLKRVGKYKEGFLVYEGVYFLPKEQTIKKDGVVEKLSKKESLLLEELLEERGVVVTNETIYLSLWEDEEPKNSSLRVYVNRLNKVLGGSYIKNIRGEGYKFEP